MLFPYNKTRNSQKEMMNAVESTLKNQKFILIHAPTGLGKTAGALAPALEYAIAHNKTIFFLTSRHTQQSIVFETVQKMNEKHGQDIQVTGIIGKKHMCSQSNVEQLNANDFAEYCKALVGDKACTFYENSKKKTIKEFIENQVRNKRPEELIKICKTHYLCPYEISTQIAKNAKVIISDYYYIFNPHIRNILFTKIKKELKDAIIIVDEAHNLPQRLRKLLTRQISNKILVLALKEAKKYQQENLIPYIQELIDNLNEMSTALEFSVEKISKRSDLTLWNIEDVADPITPHDLPQAKQSLPKDNYHAHGFPGIRGTG